MKKEHFMVIHIARSLMIRGVYRVRHPLGYSWCVHGTTDCIYYCHLIRYLFSSSVHPLCCYFSSIFMNLLLSEVYFQYFCNVFLISFSSCFGHFVVFCIWYVVLVFTFHFKMLNMSLTVLFIYVNAGSLSVHARVVCQYLLESFIA